jgi:hypothetical protein
MIYRSSRARSHRTGARAWTELYPAGKSLAMISIGGHRSAVDDSDRTGLLMIVDPIETLAQMGQPQIRHTGDGKCAALWHASPVVIPQGERRTP